MVDEVDDTKPRSPAPFSVERGAVGLRQYNGLILEEADRDLGGYKIVNLAPGTEDGDAVNKQQFDDLTEDVLETIPISQAWAIKK